MPICSYVVLPAAGARDDVAERLEGVARCDVIPARNRDLLLLVTDTGSREEEEALRETIRSVPGVHSLVLAFGDVDAPSPETRRAT